MSNIIEKTFEFFGDNVPSERHQFSAHEGNPVSIREIKKEFGSYEAFLTQYKLERIKARNLEKKEVKKDVTK